MSFELNLEVYYEEIGYKYNSVRVNDSCSRNYPQHCCRGSFSLIITSHYVSPLLAPGRSSSVRGYSLAINQWLLKLRLR